MRITLHVVPEGSRYFQREPATSPFQRTHFAPPRSIVKLSPAVLETVSRAVPVP